MIRGFCDVGACERHMACLHLGKEQWDVEAALRSFYSDSCPRAVASTSWSSRGAKLRKEEVECPICATEYTGQRQPVETTCCFQVLCPRCRERLTTEGVFSCPFCRITARVSKEDLLAWRTRWSIPQPEGRSRPAALLRGISRAFDTVVHGFLEVDRPPT